MRHRVDDWAIIVELVAAGLGVGLIPSLAGPFYRDDIAIRPIAGPGVARNIFAATRLGTQVAPTIGTVLAAMEFAAASRAEATRAERDRVDVSRPPDPALR